MPNYSSKAKTWQELQKLIREHWAAHTKEDVLKAETLATVYLLEKIGYDETGAPVTVIEAAGDALHDIIGIYISMITGMEKK